MNKESKERILIVGFRSKIAEAVIRIFAAETSWTLGVASSAVSIEQHVGNIMMFPTDYSNPKQLREISMKFLPTIIVNCAAMTDVDACEIQKKEAWAANVGLVEHLVRCCKITDAHLMHFSSDYIFDGHHGPYSEDDLPNPISYYGKTKLAGENVCLASSMDFAIFRTNVVYGFTPNGKNDFARWTLSQLERGETFRVVDDQFGNPTLSDDIAVAALHAIWKRKKGIYHIGGADYISRYTFAQNIAEVFFYDKSLILPMKTGDLRQKAPRPKRGGLRILKAETDLGLHFSTSLEGVTTLRRQMQNFSALNN